MTTMRKASKTEVERVEIEETHPMVPKTDETLEAAREIWLEANKSLNTPIEDIPYNQRPGWESIRVAATESKARAEVVVKNYLKNHAVLVQMAPNQTTSRVSGILAGVGGVVIDLEWILNDAFMTAKSAMGVGVIMSSAVIDSVRFGLDRLCSQHDIKIPRDVVEPVLNDRSIGDHELAQILGNFISTNYSHLLETLVTKLALINVLTQGVNGSVPILVVADLSLDLTKVSTVRRTSQKTTPKNSGAVDLEFVLGIFKESNNK